MLKAKLSQHLNERLPEWAHSLSNRTKAGLLKNDRLDNLEMETVRAFGRRAWLLQPNLGHSSIYELEQRIGGWHYRWARCPWPHRSRP